ncbi:MAG: Holliday junction resolvase RuvX [Cellvibrionales bacterium]|nr:Holliday junction resolvase RuvX [Cellvibrionales bacterium]
MHILAFDFGVKRFGVAVGQRQTNTAEPLDEIKAKDGIPDWQRIQKLIDEWQPECFVVGLPLNMDGSENAMCQRAKKFANRLHGRFGKPSYLHDERLTSQMVKYDNPSNDYGNNPVDSLAACLILESWLNSQ